MQMKSRKSKMKCTIAFQSQEGYAYRFSNEIYYL